MLCHILLKSKHHVSVEQSSWNA